MAENYDRKKFYNITWGSIRGAGNTKGGSITVQLTSCLSGLESAVWQLTKQVKQEVNCTMILPPLRFTAWSIVPFLNFFGWKCLTVKNGGCAQCESTIVQTDKTLVNEFILLWKYCKVEVQSALKLTTGVFVSVVHDLRLPCSRITLNKDTTVWLDGACPINTCILPSFGWITPAHLMAYPRLLVGWVCQAYYTIW